MFRRFKAVLRLSVNKIKPFLGLILRASLCYMAGLVVLAATSNLYFDNRFSVRGNQKINPTITLITISRDDVFNSADLSEQNSKNILKSLKEISDLSDMFYFNPSLWNQALVKLNQAKAKTIVMALDVNAEMASTLKLKGKNIFWSQEEDSTDFQSQTDFYPDPDGIIRHFSPHYSNFIYKIVRNYTEKPVSLPRAGSAINFLGQKNIFPTFSYTELIKGKIPASFLQNKIIIITGHDTFSPKYTTPIGVIAKGELLAHIVYNVVHNFWISETPFVLSSLYLLGILILILWVIFKYPESVALVFSAFLALGIFVLSSALFDLKAIWLPIEAPLALIVFTYVVITGYRLGESEKHSWKSEQELIYISQVEELKNNFLSLISHDLKNPLAKIQGITDRLLTSQTPTGTQDLKEDLTTIRQTSDELRQYITSILQLTKIEAREVKINKEVCDLNEIVNTVVERLDALAKSKNIKIHTQLEPLFSQELDRHLITEVLINLVENAIKYSDLGAEVIIKTEEINNEVKVEVTDSAGGIDEAELPKVFDKFFRGKGDKTIKVTGSGLGLYLVKYFIELHNGKVFIESTKGVGTRIGFTLPLENALLDVTQEQSASSTDKAVI